MVGADGGEAPRGSVVAPDVKEKLLLERLQWTVRALMGGLARVVSVGAAVATGGWRSVPDAAGEVALEAADRFAAGLAFGLLAGEVGGGVGVQAALGDGEAVQRAVELAVAAVVEAVAVGSPEEAGMGAGAGGPRELGVAGEAGRRRRSRRAAWRRSGRRSRVRRAAAARARRRVRRARARASLIGAGELADAAELVASDADARGLLGARQAAGDALLPAARWISARGGISSSGQRSCRLPAQVVDQRGALRDQALAVIDEQPDIKLGARELGDGQRVKPFADRRPRDRDGIDRVRLAALAGGRYARRPSASAAPARRALHARAGSAPARPTRAGSPRSPKHAGRIERHAPSTNRSSKERRCARTVTSARTSPVPASTAASVCESLVSVRSDHDHPHHPLDRDTEEQITGGHISVGARPRSYQVTPAILGRQRATQPQQVRPRPTPGLRVSPPPHRGLPVAPDATARRR